MGSLTARDAAITACAASALIHAYLFAEHVGDERVLGLSFGAAALALASAGYALSRPALPSTSLLAAGLFAALIAAYPIVHVVTGDPVDALGIGTKLIEAIGLAAALVTRQREESFAPLDALVGVFVGMALLSLGHGH